VEREADRARPRGGVRVRLIPVATPRPAQEPDVDAVFAALADPTRRAVIGRLAQEPASASALAGELPVSRQAIAKHLAALDRAGLVAARREGRETRYRLTPEPMGEAMAWMAGVGARWDERLARLAARATRRP
jgi:DNA-binding transcriptional ArsR family regulator